MGCVINHPTVFLQSFARFLRSGTTKDELVGETLSTRLFLAAEDLSIAIKDNCGPHPQRGWLRSYTRTHPNKERESLLDTRPGSPFAPSGRVALAYREIHLAGR